MGWPGLYYLLDSIEHSRSVCKGKADNVEELVVVQKVEEVADKVEEVCS